MSVWWTFCTALSCVPALLLAVWSWLWITRPRTNAPGPTPLPLLGNVLHFRKQPVVMGHLRELQRRYGDTFRFYIGPKLFLVVTKPEDVQKVLSVCKERDPFFIRPLRHFLGNGLITSNGDLWKTHRRIIEPTFHKEVVGGFMDAFNDGAQFVCDRLVTSGEVELNVYDVLFQGALRSLLVSALGISLDEVEPDHVKQNILSAECVDAMKTTQKIVYRPWMQIEWVISMMAEGEAYKRQINLLHSLVNHGIGILRQKKNRTEHNHRKTLIEVLVAPYGELLLSEEEVSDEIRTFVMAATDTTAATNGFVLCMLALHREWQDAVHCELDNVFGKDKDYTRSPTSGEISQLVLLESVIKETMRLFPAVPNGARLIPEDIVLDGGYVAPRGSCVFASYCLVQRQPDVFPDPDKFDPSRFLEGGSARGLPPYSYLPFSRGPRKCVGGCYAMLQMKTVLSTILRQFRILPGSTKRELEDITLSIIGHPITGFRVTCVPRDRLPAVAS